MQISSSTVADCTVLHLSGALDDSAVLIVRRALNKAIAEQPDAVVVDLAGVPTASRQVLRIFPTIARRESSSPGTILLLAAATPLVAEALLLTTAARWMGVHATVGGAVAAASEAPPRVRERLHLGATRAAPRAARRFTRERLTEWEVTDLVPATLLIVSELVTNAVLHAGTDLVLTLELGPRTLHVDVADSGPPLLGLARASDESGRGLIIVRATAGSMGVRPMVGGKGVWAVLRRPLP